MSEEPKISSGGKTQRQEILDAQKEKRIPKCICCNHDIEAIVEVENNHFTWEFDVFTGGYKRAEGHEETLDMPYHECHEDCECEYATWDFRAIEKYSSSQRYTPQ